MAGKIKRIKIFGYKLTFVFRHRYEKYENDTEKIIDKASMWREYQLGFWFRRYTVVGKKDFNKPKEWKN